MRMAFSKRYRKNTKDQKKNCVKRTFESKVTITRKFSILRAEGAREKSKFKRPYLGPRLSVTVDFFFEPAYFFDIYAAKPPCRGLRLSIFPETPFTVFSYTSVNIMKK